MDREKEPKKIKIQLDGIHYTYLGTRWGTKALFFSGIEYLVSRYLIPHLPLTTQEADIARALSSFIPLGYGLLASLTLIDNLIDQHQRKIGDSKLRFSAEQLVYESDRSDVIPARDGDNFLYITLPELISEPEGFARMTKSVTSLVKRLRGKRGERIPQREIGQEGVMWLNLAEAALWKVKKEIPKRDFSFAVVEAPKNAPDSITQALHQLPVVSLKDLLRGKGVHVDEVTPPVRVLIRSQLERFSLRESMLAEKALEFLADPNLKELLAAYHQSSGQEQASFFLRKVNIRLRRIIEQYIDRTRDYGLAITPLDQRISLRKRSRSSSLIRRAVSTPLVLEQFFEDGRYLKVAVEKILSVERQNAERIINEVSRGDDGKVAYALYLLVNRLDKNPPPTSDEENKSDSLKLIRKAGFRIGRQRWGIYEAVINFQSLWLNLAEVRKSSIIPALAFALPFIFVKPAIWAINQIPPISIPPLVEALSKPQNATDYMRPRFPGSLPTHKLEWKIDSVEGIDSAGYYITSTFGDHRRIALLGMSEATDTPGITLRKRVPLGYIGQTTLKVPINVDTRLAAIKVTNSDGTKAKSTLYQLDDGTVELVISESMVAGRDYVDVEAHQVITQDIVIKAVSGMDPLSIPKLNDEAKASALYIRSSNSEADEVYEDITNMIKNQYRYSLNPDNKALLDQAKSKEEVVNAISLLSGCTCEVCNAQLVYFASLNKDSRSWLTLAFGYIHSRHLASSAGNFLLQEAMHAVAINQAGRIFDATPTTPDDHPLTLKYLELLASKYGEKEWHSQLVSTEDLTRHRKNHIRLGLLLYTMVELASLTHLSNGLASPLLRRSSLALSWFLTKYESKPSDWRLKIVRGYSMEELETAYNFFNWISHGSGQIGQDLPSGADFKNLVQSTFTGQDRERIGHYLRNPYVWEGNAHLDPSTAIRMRELAKQILRMTK